MLGDGENVGDMPAMKSGAMYTTVWQPDDVELERIKAGGLVQLGVFWEPGQEGFPPLAVTVTDPPQQLMNPN